PGSSRDCASRCHCAGSALPFCVGAFKDELPCPSARRWDDRGIPSFSKHHYRRANTFFRVFGRKDDQEPPQPLLFGSRHRNCRLEGPMLSELVEDSVLESLPREQTSPYTHSETGPAPFRTPGRRVFAPFVTVLGETPVWPSELHIRGRSPFRSAR